MRSGRVQLRHKPLIKIWVRFFRTAGINIPQRDVERLMHLTHIRRGPNDMRRMDIITAGIDGIYGGSPLFMDVTIISPVHGTGLPMPRSADHDGAANDRAELRNRNTDYPDVEASPHAQLLSLGVETYGRWSEHSLTLMRHLAKYKSKQMPPYLQRNIECAYFTRWWNLLSVTVQNIIGISIVRPCGTDLIGAADHLDMLPAEEVSDLYR